MELVSIIVPVYNMENSLEEAMRSVLAQDYKNIEIILVDDGSKDGSLEVCHRIASYDKRVSVIHTENQGSGPARNEGIAVSKGKYLYFPDADDYLKPNAISVLVEAMEKDDCDLLVFGYRVETHDGTVISEKNYEDFVNSGSNIRSNYIDYFGMDRKYSIQGAPWNKFFHGDVIRSHSIKYPPLRRHQDEGFISRYVTYVNKVKFISDVLYTYYANTVALEWKKYPVDYVDAVVGLNQVWKETICIWNPDDYDTHLLVDKEIFSKLIKALELAYSPKMNFNFSKRVKWIKKTCHDTNIAQNKFIVAGSLYQKCLLLGIKCHLYTCVSAALFIGTVKNKMRQG